MTPNAVTPAISNAAAPSSRRRARRSGGGRGAVAGSAPAGAGRSSAGSWARIASCNRCSSAPGSTPISSTSAGARLAVGLERLRLPAGAVKREHPLAVQALAQRVLSDQRVELADHLGVPTGLEVGVDRHLGRRAGAAPRAGGSRRRRTARRPGPRAARRATAQAPRAGALVEQALGQRDVDVAVGSAAARSRGRGSRSGRRCRRAAGAGARRRAAPSSPRSAATRRPRVLPRGGPRRPSGLASRPASRVSPAACGGPGRRAGPRGEPRAALTAAVPPCERH